MKHLKLLLIALMFSPMLAVAQCPPGQSEVIIHIVPDNWPDEISWKLYVEDVLTETGTYNSDTICVDTSACMRFEIYDAWGDGLCCDPPGSYSVFFRGDTVAMAVGSEYTYSDITEFNCPPGWCIPGLSSVFIQIDPDDYPEDISWKLFANDVLAGSGTSNNDTICVDTSACIRFEMYDSNGDGLCCGGASGPGSYYVYFRGDTVAMATGNEYTEKDITVFNCQIDTLEIMTALQAMIAHVNGSIPLSLAQREQYYQEIIQDYAYIFPSIASDVYTYIRDYEANFPVLFENRGPVALDNLAPETRLLITLEQYILDTQCTAANAANMEGIVFEVSNIFPGPVAAAAPRVPNAVVPVNGTHVRIPSAIIAFDDIPAKRPTGYYAPPGEIVTIIIPAHLTGARLVAQIGAHDVDHGTWLNRLPRISNDFPLNSTHTQIISPVGGGIYIKIPESSNLGWFDIIVEKAVKSPYFSLRTGHETAPGEWATDLNNHFVEWVDLESDKFMMTLPLKHLKDLNLNDPTSLLSQWDDIMDAYNYLGGRPADVRVKAEYFAIDSRLGGVYGIGYPQIIGEWDAPFGPFNVADFYPTQVLNTPLHIHQNNASGLYIVFHEMGHANAHPKLATERETIVHIYATYIYNVLYGIPLDEAFKYSSFQLMTLDQAAFDWMITHNFRRNANMGCDPVEPPGACDELQYQHRGHAKYIEMAKHFGWSSIHEMNKVFYDQDVINPGVWDDIFKTSDEMIAAASNAQGVNLSPLFHFWGLAPSPQLAMQLDSAYGASPVLCEMLRHYKTVVPTSVSEVEDFYFDIHNPNGSTIGGRFAIYVDEFESMHYYDSIQAQIDFLIETYGPCEITGTAEQEEAKITVSPNPTNGLVNIHFENEAPTTVQVTDVYGRIVFHQKNVSGPDLSFHLDEAPGLYMLQIGTGLNKALFKILKVD